MCEEKVKTAIWKIHFFPFFFVILCLPFFVNAQIVELTWSPDLTSTVSFFKIYKSTENDSNYILLNSVNFPDSTFQDEAVEYNTTYYYSVTAVDETGLESELSNTVEIITPRTFTLSVTKNQDEAGSVTVQPQKAEYLDGEEVTLSASAKAGYLFDFWSEDVTGHDSVITIIMDSSKNIIANFKSNSVSITGSITYVNSELPMSYTEVNLDGGISDTLAADENGFYSANALQPGANYSIAPKRNKTDYESSILSYDAALAARIAVRLETNPTEISKIAADVNGDGKVQLYDASLIAMQAIGLTEQPASQIGEWGFYPAKRSYDQLSTQYTNQNFTAIIRGDVDGNWQPNGPLLKNNITKTIYSGLNDIQAQPGDQISIPLIAYEDIDVLSFDICLNYDLESLKYVGLKKTDLLKDFQIFENTTNNGWIKVGGFSLTETNLTGTYLEMVFEVVGETGSSSQIELESYRLNADQAQYANATVAIEENKNLDKPTDYVLHNNYPNPFNPETNIQFDIPESGNVSLKIYNMLGQQVKALVEETKTAGTHRVQWDGSNEDGQSVPSGVYVYRLIAENFTATKKMSLMK
jgi:hypothetical protein